MSLKNNWLTIQLRPRVIHRLPGRMRIHFPALQKINGNFHDIANVLLKGFRLPDHFSEVQINYITGNILIVYQVEKLVERQVMDWIFDIKKIVESIVLKFFNMDDEAIKISQIKLLHYLQDASQNGNVIDKKFNIPDEIWN